MTKCGVLDSRGLSCVEQAVHPGEHWFQTDANICDLHDERGYVCTLCAAHEGNHRFHREATPYGSVSRVFCADDDPVYVLQRAREALSSTLDPTVPDNSDLEEFADVLSPQDQVALWAGRASTLQQAPRRCAQDAQGIRD